MSYVEYINKVNLSYDEAYGNCEKICRQIVNKFPELTLVRGHYYCSAWGERMHWWIQLPNGDVFDPTKVQFPSKGLGVYVPWNEGDPEPTGKCPKCGEYIYDGSHVHEHCIESFMAHLNEV